MVAAGANVARTFEQETVRALKPAVGQLLLLQEGREIIELVQPRQTVLSTFAPAGPPQSLQDRLRDFFRRLLNDEMYDAVCFLTSTAPPDVTVREPDSAMGFASFAAKITARIEGIREARRQGNIQAAELGRRLAERDDLSVVVAGLSTTDAGRVAVDLDVIHRRRQTVAELRDLVLNPDTTENEIQKMIGRKYWLFGGQYTGVLERRDGFALDEHDIPLVCADRSIHIIELKRPGHRLVKAQRNHLIVSNDVHAAVGQCMNYLRGIDELGAAMGTYHRNELGLEYDYRRARGTVIIGHPDLSETDNITREQVEQTIRSYNAHLSRVQVITFADLVDSADRALRFEAEEL